METDTKKIKGKQNQRASKGGKIKGGDRDNKNCEMCAPPIIKNAQGYQFCNSKVSNTETLSKKRKGAWLGSSTEVCRHRRLSGEEMTSQKGVVTAPAREHRWRAERRGAAGAPTAPGWVLEAAPRVSAWPRSGPVVLTVHSSRYTGLVGARNAGTQGP